MDVPSPINLQDLEEARKWAEEVMEKRPYRADVFKKITQELKMRFVHSVLELGSGPGFLAKHILLNIEEIDYFAFDFSEAMHEIAKERLGEKSDQVNFIQGSFKETGWQDNLLRMDAVITIQAVHEVRHKNNTHIVFNGAYSVLKQKGIFLYCDHVCDENGIINDQLYMTESEQQQALKNANFTRIEKILRIGSLALWRGEKL